MAASDPINNRSAQLKTHMAEYVKTYVEYDGLDRIDKVYTASSLAADGDSCIVTQYSYVGGTSKVQYMKESETTWQIAWETF